MIISCVKQKIYTSEQQGDLGWAFPGSVAIACHDMRRSDRRQLSSPSSIQSGQDAEAASHQGSCRAPDPWLAREGLKPGQRAAVPTGKMATRPTSNPTSAADHRFLAEIDVMFRHNPPHPFPMKTKNRATVAVIVAITAALVACSDDAKTDVKAGNEAVKDAAGAYTDAAKETADRALDRVKSDSRNTRKAIDSTAADAKRAVDESAAATKSAIDAAAEKAKERVYDAEH